MYCNLCSYRCGRLCNKYKVLMTLIDVDDVDLIFCSVAACTFHE